MRLTPGYIRQQHLSPNYIQQQQQLVLMHGPQHEQHTLPLGCKHAVPQVAWSINARLQGLVQLRQHATLYQ